MRQKKRRHRGTCCFGNATSLCLPRCDQLLLSPVISKELDVLLAMVAALRCELDEVQLYSNCIPIVSSFAAIIFSADLWSFHVFPGWACYRLHLTVFRIAHSSNLMGVIDIDGNGMSTYRYTQNWNHIIQDYIKVNMHTGARTHTLHIYTQNCTHIDLQNSAIIIESVS